MDEMPGNIIELVRAEVELARYDLFTHRLRHSKISVKRPIIDIVAGRQLDALGEASRIVERREEDRGAKLAFVDQILGDLVIGVEADFQSRQQDLRYADIEIMGALGLDRVVGGHRRRRAGVGEQRQAGV